MMREPASFRIIFFVMKGLASGYGNYFDTLQAFWDIYIKKVAK